MNILFAMGQPGGEGGTGIEGTLIMFGAIFLIFYFMIIRPQQKRTKERQRMLDAVQKGDKVITNGGIHGTIAGIEEKTILLDVGNNVKLKIQRESVMTILR